MNPTHQFVRNCSDRVWGNPAIRSIISNHLERGMPEPAAGQKLWVPGVRFEVDPRRLHSDFVRLCSGEKPQNSENIAALTSIKSVLDELEFEPSKESRNVRDDSLKLMGEMDAIGRIDNLTTFVELKVLPYIPRRARAADAAQLLLYSIARDAAGDRSEEVHLALYILAGGSFTAVAHTIPEPADIEPVVHLTLAA